MIKRASPAQLRKALELANLFVKTGINFVPVPVTSDEEQDALGEQAIAKMEQILQAIDGATAQEGQP